MANILTRLFRPDEAVIKRYISDELSGLGITDKVTSSDYTGSTDVNESLANRMYRNSWFIKALVDYQPDDMFVRWRAFDDETDVMEQAENDFDVVKSLNDAIRAGRLYGTGLVVMVVADDDMSEPLDVNMVMQGDLRRLHVSDRYHATQVGYYSDFGDVNYGKPVFYDIRLGGGGEVRVHSSRVLRFDGISDVTNLEYGITKWGKSVLHGAVNAAKTDDLIAESVGHLSQEASTPVLHVKGLNDKVARSGMNSSDDASMSVMESVREFNRMRSNYRTSVIDADDDLSRVDVRWGQLPAVIETHYKRLAAIAQMPATRLLGQSPVGMNATGDSDLRNYAMSILSLQHRILGEPLERLDTVLALNAGLSEPPTYKFLPLIDLSELDKGQATAEIVGAVANAVTARLVSVEEGRRVLNETGLLGDLDKAFEPDEPVADATANSE